MKFKSDIDIDFADRELILQKSISGPTFEVETSGLNSGMYFVELRGSMFHWYQKIIKQ